MTKLVGAAMLLALWTGLAAATPATLERTANVRSGPGTAYPVIAKLPRGSVVDAEDCGSWCEVAWSGGQGYVARSLLALSGSPSGAPVAVAPGPAQYEDGYLSYDYPGFDYPGYVYEPPVGAVVTPRWRRDHRRWSGWRHRPQGLQGLGPQRPGWAGHASQPPVGGSPGMRGWERGPIGRAGVPNPALGARSTVGGPPAGSRAAIVPLPATPPAAPAVSTPPMAAPVPSMR